MNILIIYLLSLEYIIETYPESDFALDSSFKLDLIHETLASKEMYIAKHYIKKQKWIAAIYISLEAKVS